MTKLTKRRLGHGGKILLGIVAIAGVVTVAAALPGLAIALAPFLKNKHYTQKQYIDRTVDSLITHGLLTYTKDKHGEVALRLTRKGKWEAAIRRLDIASNKNDKWDSLWRIVIFDIPEHKKFLRSEFRRAMKLYGFKQLQKSVWVYPYSCNDFIDYVRTHLGVSRDVLYLRANFLENDQWLREEFEL